MNVYVDLLSKSRFIRKVKSETEKADLFRATFYEVLAGLGGLDHSVKIAELVCVFWLPVGVVESRRLD